MTAFLKNVFVNPICKLVPNLIMVLVKVAMANINLAKLIMQGPAVKMVMLKPALVHQDKLLTKNALMTRLILINVSAAPISYLAHHLCKVQGLAVAANINLANARQITKLVVAELQPELLLVLGTE